MTRAKAGVLWAFFLLGLPATVRSEEAVVSLKLADSLPVGHVIREYVTKPFMEAVTRASAGRIAFKDFPGEQLGKAQDLLALTQTGVADIGYVVPSYTSEKMPLSGVAELPGAFRTSCQGTIAYWSLTRDGAILESREFSPNGIKPLIVLFLPPYQVVLSTSRRFTGAADIAGLKIRTIGGGMDLMMRALGGVPVRMAPPVIHESMSRGTIDGTMLPYQSIVSYGLHTLVKSGSLNENFGTPVVTYSISLNRWKSLPEDVRKILAEEGEKITRSACEVFTAEEGRAIVRVREAGAKLIELSSGDQKTLAERFEEVRKNWAADLDRRAKPGSPALAAFEAAAAAATQ